MEVVLIRHGFSVGNQKNTLSGWTDVPLTQEGIQELIELKNKNIYPETERVFSSDLSRAYDTAKILYPDHEIVKLPAFREINFGIYENMNAYEINFKDFFEDWINGQVVEEGENYFQFRQRVLQGFCDLSTWMTREKVNHYTLVSHAGVIKVLLMALLQKPPKSYFEMEVSNGLGYYLHLNLADSSMKLLNFNGISV